jgi:hypothetical protein
VHSNHPENLFVRHPEKCVGEVEKYIFAYKSFFNFVPHAESSEMCGRDFQLRKALMQSENFRGRRMERCRKYAFLILLPTSEYQSTPRAAKRKAKKKAVKIELRVHNALVSIGAKYIIFEFQVQGGNLAIFISVYRSLFKVGFRDFVDTVFDMGCSK